MQYDIRNVSFLLNHILKETDYNLKQPVKTVCRRSTTMLSLGLLNFLIFIYNLQTNIKGY